MKTHGPNIRLQEFAHLKKTQILTINFINKCLKGWRSIKSQRQTNLTQMLDSETGVYTLKPEMRKYMTQARRRLGHWVG
jgi:hypothetical protein